MMIALGVAVWVFPMFCVLAVFAGTDMVVVGGYGLS